MSSKSPGQQLIERAIEAAGGTSAVAREFQISPASVSGWIKRATVPIERCIPLERLCKGIVTCEQMRPDFDWHRAIVDEAA
jgi:DNA-binding transcriptional regulator YdaS (Cro superfamily)